MVATNDSHYLCEDDAHAQDVMLCIQMGKSIHDTNRMKFDGTQFFVKSSRRDVHGVQGFARSSDAHTRHRRALQPASGESCESVSRISKFRRVSRSTAISSTSRGKALRSGWTLCVRCNEQGKLKHTLADYEQRLKRELGIIQQMQFSGYFLIVWDFIRYAQASMTSRLARAVDRRQVRWSPTRSASPTSTLCSTNFSSSVS